MVLGESGSEGWREKMADLRAEKGENKQGRSRESTLSTGRR